MAIVKHIPEENQHEFVEIMTGYWVRKELVLGFLLTGDKNFPFNVILKNASGAQEELAGSSECFKSFFKTFGLENRCE